jgi:MFS family permease
MFVVSVPAMLCADRFGRRTIVIVGGLSLGTCMVIVGSLYASNSVVPEQPVAGWFIIILIFIFALTYVTTWGIVGKIYASEIQPARNRATANSIAQSLNFVRYFPLPLGILAPY